MAKKTLNINGNASQMVGDANDNFTELYGMAGGGSGFLKLGDTLSANRSFTSQNIESVTIDATLKKGGVYTIDMSGTAHINLTDNNYLELYVVGNTSGYKRLVYSKWHKKGESLSLPTSIEVLPTEDSSVMVKGQINLTLNIAITGTYSILLNNALVDKVPTIWDKDTMWPRYTMQTIRGSHDLSWHKGKLWSFNKPSDGSSYIVDESNAVVKTLSMGMNESWKNETSNSLQFKSVDWHLHKNLLLIGNGQQSYSVNDSYCYIFYEAEGWETQSGTITFENCGEYKRIDFSALGAKCYGYWGSDAEADTMYVSVNLFRDIYLVQLGKGSHDLSQLTDGGGEFESGLTDESNSHDSKYNGTWVVKKHWHQEEYDILPGKTVRQSDHGGQFYGGCLYLGDNRTDMALVYRITFHDDGTMTWKRIRFTFPAIGGTGEISGYYVDGVCLRDGKLYANILGRDVVAIAELY